MFVVQKKITQKLIEILVQYYKLYIIKKEVIIQLLGLHYVYCTEG